MDVAPVVQERHARRYTTGDGQPVPCCFRGVVSGAYQRPPSEVQATTARALYQLHNQRSATGARAAKPKHLSRHAVTITTSSHSQVCLKVNPFPSLKVMN